MVESYLVKKPNKHRSRITFVLLGILALVISSLVPVIPVYASTTNDIQIFEYGVGKVFMTYSSDVPASETLNNGSAPFYNLYEVPLNFNMYRGSNTTTSINYYTGWAYVKITIGLNRNSTQSYIETISQDPNVSIAYETVTQSGNNVIIGCFFAFDDLQVGRSANMGSLMLHTRYNTSAASDTLSITGVSVSDTVIHMSQNSVPTTNGSLVMSIVQGLQNAGDIDTIINVLNAIKSNTDLYQQVVTQLSGIRSDLSAILQAINGGSAGSTVDSAVANQSQAVGDYIADEESLLSLAPGGPPQAQALGTQITTFVEQVQQSLFFWSYELRYFLDSIGLFWILIIIGLIIGTTAFLLRLRK